MRSHGFICLCLLATIVVGISSSSVSAATTIACQIQITSVKYPPTASLQQTVDVNTDLTATCTPSAVDISGRLDLNDVSANKTLSTSGIHVGFVGGAGKTLNFSVVNRALAPSTPTTWNLQLRIILIAGGIIVGETRKSLQIQVGQAGQTSQVSQTSQASQTGSGVTTTGSAATSEGQTQGSPLSIGTLGIVGGILAAIVLGAVVVVTKRKKPPSQELTQQKVVQEIVPEVPKPRPAVPRESYISTGYPDLDNILAGGLPVGYAVLIVSPPCDERDLLIRRIIESDLSADAPTYFASRDLGRTQDLADRYKDNFYAFCPQADKMTPQLPNVFKISGVQNLNDVNISMGKAMESIGKKDAANKVIIMDLFSDVLLEHGALTTRKWLDDFLAKRKAEGFTLLGTLNPMIASKQEAQTIIDLFDGIIEIYEKEIRERSRRFLTVKKMYGRKYVETELMLDKDKLF